MDQPNWTPNEGSYHYAYQLIEQIINLNRGNYLKRPGGQNPVELEAMDFCIGSAVYPEHPDENERIEFFKKKVLAGAEYGISQMLFDTDAYARFLDLCQKHKIHVPILPGTRVLKSRQQGERMAKRFEVGLPPELANSLPDEEAAKKDPEGAMEQSIEAFVKITERFKKLGAPGLHLFDLTDTVISCRLLKELSNG